MLADSKKSIGVGRFSEEIHLPASFRHALLDFIYQELPEWRDDPKRRHEESETILTEQLCSYMTGAARRSGGWDVVHFQAEVADETNRGRKIDLSPRPCGITAYIGGQEYSPYDTIIPIECKRLPTPKGERRDEREYVLNRLASTGGIQRFKAGDHGGTHQLGAMIAYIQRSTLDDWRARVVGWIGEIVRDGTPGWSAHDTLSVVDEDVERRVAHHCSCHYRAGLPDIELRHLWIVLDQVQPSAHQSDPGKAAGPG